jgi:hypothetical protein
MWPKEVVLGSGVGRCTPLFAMLLAATLPATPADAITLQMTSGMIRMDTTTPAPFADVSVDLAGPDFS